MSSRGSAGTALENTARLVPELRSFVWREAPF